MYDQEIFPAAWWGIIFYFTLKDKYIFGRIMIYEPILEPIFLGIILTFLLSILFEIRGRSESLYKT